MNTYELPPDPKRDAWDRNGHKWEYSAVSGAYRFEGELGTPYGGTIYRTNSARY